MRQLHHVFLYVLAMGIAHGALAQEVARSPVAGVVWQQPPNLPAAAADLTRMRSMGVQAVRTSPVLSDELLTLADTLGLALYQDLPIIQLPAQRLRDTLDYAVQLVSQMGEVAGRHSSASAIGLARRSDTSDSTACAYFSTLAEQVRRISGGRVQVYYVSRFIESDQCGETVDFVLLDALHAPDPLQLVRRWQAAHPDIPVGIASIGSYVNDDQNEGLNVEGSPQYQARLLETWLREIFVDRSDTPPVAAFVYRWRDIQPGRPSPAFDLENPYRHAFGLFRVDGQARPAADVVSGIFSGRQNVFAFTSGPPPEADHPLSTLAGWIVLAVLGIAFASSPRLRPMVPRYFSAHGFYREAVREGRDVLLTASIVLLVCLSLAVAIIWLSVFEVWRTTPQFLLLFDMLPRGTAEFIVTILGRPILLLMLVGSIYGVGLTIWGAILAFLSRKRYPLSPAQALMLAIWPRWSVLVLMLAAMVVATLPDEYAFIPAAVLLGVWILVTLWAMARTLYDYATVTRVSGGRLALGFVLNPLILIVLALFVLALRYMPETMFLWHAITRA